MFPLRVPVPRWAYLKKYFCFVAERNWRKKVEYIILDDASDSTTAVKNARKLVSEDKVDLLIGSTIVPTSLAMIDVAAETETPMISMAAAALLFLRLMQSVTGYSRRRKMIRICQRRSSVTWPMPVLRQ
jgi:hypothetical protein